MQTLQSAEWKLIGKDVNDCKWFYDEANIKRLPEHKAMVWLKRMVTDEEKKKWIQERTRNKQSIEGYDRWAYELGLMELNCSAGTIRQLNVTDYDRDGKYLTSRKISENLNVIGGDSIAELVYKLLCPTKTPDKERMTPQFPPIR